MFAYVNVSLMCDASEELIVVICGDKYTSLM
jgi:hypothetical protein